MLMYHLGDHPRLSFPYSLLIFHSILLTFANMRRLLAFILLAFFVVYTTPRELWHAMADHHDTVHHHDEQGTHIEPQHHHCDILKYNQQLPFTAITPSVLLASSSPALFARHINLFTQKGFTQNSHHYKPLRAPPITVV